MNLFTPEIKSDLEAQQRVREWIAELRFGNHKQGRSRLRDGNKFCCLGIACNLHDPSRWEALYGRPDVRRFKYIGSPGEDDYKIGILPDDVVSAYCMSAPDGAYSGGGLASHNDAGKTFSEIANIIGNELELALR